MPTGCEVVAHYAEFLKHIAAHVDTLVTGNAAIMFELEIPGLFLRRDGGLLSAEVAIEARVWRNQGSLVAGDGVLDVRAGDSVPIRIRKRAPILRVLRDLCDYILPIGSHLNW